MPGEVDRPAQHPLSFYGSRKYTNGYCTRQTISRQRNGLKAGLSAGSNKLMLYSRMNGGKSRCNRGTYLSSNKIPAGAHQSASELAPRHCRYFNMQVRRFPRRQLASTSSYGVNGSNLSGTRNLTAHRSNGSALKTPLMEKALVKSKESRVLISAELKNKADSKMKNSLVSDHKSSDSARDINGTGGGSGYKKVHKSDDVKKTDGSVLEKSCDKGLQLRNGRSLPECNDIQPGKSDICIARRQSGSTEYGMKTKKYRTLHRSRSFSPTKSLALSRPRRNAIPKRSVCSVLISYFVVLIL